MSDTIENEMQLHSSRIDADRGKLYVGFNITKGPEF
jgi:hypothetical protein